MYHHYSIREDWKYGMYENNKGKDKIKEASMLLWSESLYDSMLRVINEWVISSDENMTNVSQNRQAYLWQAACCIEYGLSWDMTIKARQMLSKDQQDRANKIADDIIRLYEIKHIVKYYSLFTYEELCQ